MLTWEPALTPKGRHRILDGLPLWFPTLVCNRCGKKFRFKGQGVHKNLISRSQWTANHGSFEYGAFSLETRLEGPEGPVTVNLDLCREPCSMALHDLLLELGAVTNENRSGIDYGRSAEGRTRTKHLWIHSAQRFKRHDDGEDL